MIKTKKQLETNHINELLKNIRYAYKIAGLYICSDKKFIKGFETEYAKSYVNGRDFLIKHYHNFKFKHNLFII